MKELKPISIVGGGPAGLATAIALRQAGARVAVFDHAHPPQDKACGEGLLPECVGALAELGIRFAPECGYRFHGIRFSDANHSVSACFPRGPAIGLRRPQLHRVLLARAEELGVELHWDVQQLPALDGCLTISADGENSRFRREHGLDAVVRETRRYGFRRHYRIAPWSPYMELYWGTNCQLYITPVAADQVCVAAMSRNPRCRLDEALREFPEVRERLASAAVSSREAGAPSVSRKLQRVTADDFALVGDASGSVDAITGEGLCLSFKQALSLADAVRAGDLQWYEEEHARLGRRPHQMSWLLLALDRFPRLRRTALAGLARRPSWFAALLSFHVVQSFDGTRLHRSHPGDHPTSMAKATWLNTVLADSDKTEQVEGNHYFPRESIQLQHLESSSYTSVCPWKGTAHYYNVIVDGKKNDNAAWYYPEPKEAAANIKNHVAFWKGVEVRD
ncbi:MAG TPA: DUF427 domain-containing protein [Bryobacteraceae bacterium]|nr:DUF427 domain-containing protein [Bryobacteraceae bacterium]